MKFLKMNPSSSFRTFEVKSLARTVGEWFNNLDAIIMVTNYNGTYLQYRLIKPKNRAEGLEIGDYRT